MPAGVMHVLRDCDLGDPALRSAAPRRQGTDRSIRVGQAATAELHAAGDVLAVSIDVAGVEALH